jgi:hypothetical protein
MHRDAGRLVDNQHEAIAVEHPVRQQRCDVHTLPAFSKPNEPNIVAGSRRRNAQFARRPQEARLDPPGGQATSRSALLDIEPSPLRRGAAQTYATRPASALLPARAALIPWRTAAAAGAGDGRCGCRCARNWRRRGSDAMKHPGWSQRAAQITAYAAEDGLAR